MTPPAPRSAAIDAVRVLGVLAVAAGHLWASPPEAAPNVARLITYSWHVPLFFFLTGYLGSTRIRSMKEETRNRWRSLIVPYLAWTVVLGIPLAIATMIRTGNIPWDVIGVTIWGGGAVRGPFAPYWFLPLLFFVAIALRALSGAPRWVPWTLAIFGLIASYMWGEQLAMLPQNVFFTLPAMLFALIGQMVARTETRVKERARPLLGVALLAVSGVLVLTRVSAPMDMKLGNFGTPVVSVVVAVAISWGLVLCAKSLFAQAPAWLNTSVTELAIVSTTVLLTHTFAFTALIAAGLPGLAVFVCGVTVSWSLGLILHRTPLSRALVGTGFSVRPDKVIR